VLDWCVQAAIDIVTVFEDDAIASSDCNESLLPFLESVPANWDMIYLGGQLLKKKENPPQKVNDLCFRAFNVNRMHAYMIRGGMIRIARDYLLAHETWAGKHHCDHRLGELHTSRNVYIPKRWLFGQSAHRSDISGFRHGTTFWFWD
jgi:hypothetical protein